MIRSFPRLPCATCHSPSFSLSSRASSVRRCRRRVRRHSTEAPYCASWTVRGSPCASSLSTSCASWRGAPGLRQGAHVPRACGERADVEGGGVTIHGLPRDVELSFVVTANGHAKTFSPRFVVEEGPASVTVALVRGGILLGRVLDVD